MAEIFYLPQGRKRRDLFFAFMILLCLLDSIGLALTFPNWWAMKYFRSGAIWSFFFSGALLGFGVLKFGYSLAIMTKLSEEKILEIVNEGYTIRAPRWLLMAISALSIPPILVAIFAEHFLPKILEFVAGFSFGFLGSGGLCFFILYRATLFIVNHYVFNRPTLLEKVKCKINANNNRVGKSIVDFQ